MSEMTCCPLTGGDEAPAELYTAELRKAAKRHTCSECDDAIDVGDRYEHVKGMWDGRWSTFKTCLSCVEIRDHFGCEGYVFGQVWENLEENFFPDMKAGGPCMEGLSPAAKSRLFERRLAWLEADS